MQTQSLAVALAVCLVYGETKSNPSGPKTDLQRLQGTWIVVSGEAKGKPAPDEAIKEARWIVRENQITCSGGGGQRVRLVFKLDPNQTPRAIDLTNPKRKETLQGIYQIGKDTWKLCVGAPGENRPKSFATSSRDRVVVFIFRRIKS
jgi:uncharacterized protein (TIGR03067 family)